MKAYFKLIRFQNLLIIAATMFFVRYCLVEPVFNLNNVYLQMNIFDFSMLVLSIVLIAAAGYAINDYFDVKIDAINKPEKNVLHDKIPLRRAMAVHTTLSIIGVVMGVYASYKVGNVRLSFIPVVMCFILWFYSVKYKRIVLWGNLTVSLLSAFSIIIVWLFEFFALKSHPFAFVNMVGNFGAVNILVFSYAFFAFITSMIREIIKDCEDIEGDREMGCYTFPIAFGLEKAKKLALGLIISTIILIALAEIRIYSWGYLYLLIYLVVTVQLLYLYMISMLLKAKEKKDYTFLSNLAKIIMVAGVLSMQILYISM
jgi:4-hydroxybenzoate polyprenyltransferase